MSRRYFDINHAILLPESRQLISCDIHSLYLSRPSFGSGLPTFPYTLLLERKANECANAVDLGLVVSI
jgi:hypothetical protein